MSVTLYDKKERHFYNDLGAGSVILYTDPYGKERIRVNFNIREITINPDEFEKRIDELVKTAKEIVRSIAGG